MLAGNVIISRHELSERLVALLDSIDDPVSIASAIRDRDGRILDLRLEFVNVAAAIRAVQLGDGYLSTWRVRETTPAPG